MLDAAKINTAKHLGYLDSLRALAALYVILHHASMMLDIQKESILTKALTYPFRFGQHAVDLFIVLSGFCLMLPVVRGDGTLRGGAVHFFKRRAGRILPPYYLAMAFSLFLIFAFSINHKTGTQWDVSVPVTWYGVLTHLFLVQDAFNSFNINHPFWSIAVEWRIYFLFPVLVLLWRRIGGVTTTLVTLVASLALYGGLTSAIGNSLTAQFLGLFAMGMLGAGIVYSPDAAMKRWRALPWGWGIALATAGALALMFRNGIHEAGPSYFVTDYFVGLGAMAILIWLSKNEHHPVTRTLNRKPLVFLGTFAYSIYLIHAPILQILWQYPFAPLRSHLTAMFLAYIFLGLPLILGVAYLFFLACERPFLRSRKKEDLAALAGEAIGKPAP